MLTMALFSIISFAQGVKLADGVEPLPADAETPGSEYTLVFHDEFNEPDGTLPNTKVWRYCTRRPKVTWARFLSNSPEVAFMRMVISFCVPFLILIGQKMMWKCFQAVSKPVRASPFALVV